MKIAILIYAYEPSLGELGGVRKPIELAKGLEAIGHEPAVFVPDFLTVEAGAVEVVPYSTLSTRVLRAFSAYISMSWKLWRRSKKIPLDLVYLRTSRNFVTGLVTRWIGARFVFEINGDAFGEQGWSQGLLRGISILAADWINCKLAHQVIAITPGLGEMVQRRYRVPASRVCCIGSGTNLEEIRPLDPRRCREDLGIDASSPTAVFLGVLYEHQGVQTLISAMTNVVAREPRARLVIVGDGPMMATLRNQAHSSGLEDSVLFAGSVSYEQVQRYLGAATCCVAPFLSGRGEASPLKLFDYMAAGRPIVASEIPSIRDLLEASAAIVAVPPENASRLAEEILLLFGDPARCQSLGEAGRRYVEQHRGWAQIAERMISACSNDHEGERRQTA